MSTIVYFGEDVVSLDKAVLELQKNYQQKLSLEDLTLESVQNAVGNPGLFDEKKLILFKNIFLKQIIRGKLSSKIEQIISLLSKYNQIDTLYIEEDPNKSKYYKTYFPKALYKEFKVPLYLFYFLDAFFPGNGQKCFEQYKRTVKKTAAELAFHMLKRRVRELLLLMQNKLTGNYMPWQLGKLKSQSAKWKEDELVSVYESLFRIEKGIKTGTQVLGMEKLLDTAIALYL